MTIMRKCFLFHSIAVDIYMSGSEFLPVLVYVPGAFVCSYNHLEVSTLLAHTLYLEGRGARRPGSILKVVSSNGNSVLLLSSYFQPPVNIPDG